MYPEVHTLADDNLRLEWCGGTMVPKGSDVSISTQPEEERMQVDPIIETTD